MGSLFPVESATSSVTVSGSRILTLGNIPKEQVYAMKLKGLAICFNMLKAALCGNYVNFGVIRLYGDQALDNALEVFVKTLLSIPQTDILVTVTPRYCLHRLPSHSPSTPAVTAVPKA